MIYKVEHFHSNPVKLMRFDGTHKCYKAIVMFLTHKNQTIHISYTDDYNLKYCIINITVKDGGYRKPYDVRVGDYIGFDSNQKVILRDEKQVEKHYTKIEGEN